MTDAQGHEQAHERQPSSRQPGTLVPWAVRPSRRRDAQRFGRADSLQGGAGSPTSAASPRYRPASSALSHRAGEGPRLGALR